MLFMKRIISVAILGFVITIAGCGGGGGGGSSATPEDKVFQLFPNGFFNAGYKETYSSLVGSDNVGGRLRGNWSIQTQNTVIIESEPVVPVSLLLEVTDTTTNEFFTSVQSDYYVYDDNNVYYLGIEDKTLGISYIASSIEAIPRTAKIGDFGTIGTYENNYDREIVAASWRLTSANNGLANLVLSITYRDQYGNISCSEEQSFVIDEYGDRKSLSVRLYYADGYTMTLSGKKT